MLEYSFVYPAILEPHIVGVEIPSSVRDTVKQGLQVIAMILQQLADNQYIVKDEHMTFANTTLQQSMLPFVKFCLEVVVRLISFIC